MSNVLREGVWLFVCGLSTDNVFFFLNQSKMGWLMFSSWKHLCTKVTPDFQLTKSQCGKSKVGIKMMEINNSRLVIHIHNMTVILWRTVSK